MVVSNVNANNITNNSLITNSIQTNNLILSNHKFIETAIYLYISNKTFPVIKTTLIELFNISQITSMAITIKPNYRADMVDSNNDILFSITNTTDNSLFNQPIPYNVHMIRINVYDCYNVLII